MARLHTAKLFEHSVFLRTCPGGGAPTKRDHTILSVFLVAIYERLSALAHAIAIKSYPNTEANLKSMQLEMCYYTISWLHKACITPGFRFYQHKFSVEFHDTVREFKAARLCCPVKVQELHPNARYIMCYYMQCNICPTITSVQELKQFG